MRADKRPQLADLRESGSLEQDPDVVMFIYREQLYIPETPDRRTAEIIVSKHRNGPTGAVQLAFLDHYTRFANIARGVQRRALRHARPRPVHDQLGGPDVLPVDVVRR